ncbi:DUF106 domain-containing protein [Candidatus Woesearchaeota archaeon]|nr:DUF106 domain-containing protein [Candidatus Woesearchaeota archaeon]
MRNQTKKMVLESILDPVFGPLLSLPPLLAVGIMSLVISLIVVMIYKFTTDQDLMKQLKSELKEYRKEMKELKKHPERLEKVNREMMETNLKYMKQSFKPMLITMIPVFIIFGWMNAHMAYLPITPGEEFTTTMELEKGIEGEVELIAPEEIEMIDDPLQKIGAGEARWRLKGPAGEYMLEYRYEEESYTKELIITDEREYAEPELKVKDDEVNAIRIGNKPLKPLDLGFWQIGWLGTYIIFSIIFSQVLRKLLKVH